jgi:transcriptional regulator with XRE-family HTH domain
VSDFGSPTVRRRRLAAELRRLRDGARLTGDQVAERLGWSPSKISRYELARTGLNPADVGKLLDLYGVDGRQRDELLALAREARLRGWWQAYSDALPEDFLAFIGLEAEARSVRQWHAEVVPGLLQTQAYAREVLRGFQKVAIVTPRQIERRLQARLERQQLLLREPPPELHIVLDESVLLRRLGDNATMDAQLRRMVEVSQLPNVTLQVLPLDRHHPLTLGSFVLLTFGDERRATLHDVVSTEHLTSEQNLEDEADTYTYGLAFDSLTEVSLGPDESRELIVQTAQRIWPP